MPRLSALSPLAVLLILAVGCTKKNEYFCCTTAEDCERLHLAPDDLRTCGDGLVCVQNNCVAPSCESSGCLASAPVCDSATDECAGCIDSTQCAQFADQHVCEQSSGSCVECTADTECSTAKPVCDTMACRGCKLDSECTSGVCTGDGTCLGEASIVYLAADGNDLAPCSKTQPCKELQFAIRQTSGTRERIVLKSGTYVLGQSPTITTQNTSATRVTIHGNGAILDLSGVPDLLFRIVVPTTLRDLSIVNLGAAGVHIESDVLIEHTTIRALYGIVTYGQLTLRDVRIEPTFMGVELAGGGLVIDRVTIKGGTAGITDDNLSSTLVNITNLLVYGSTDIGLDLDGSTGSLAFSTIAGTGVNSTTTSGLKCGSLTVKSSIIWTNSASSPITCFFAPIDTIAGPTAVTGAMNVDPMFISPASENLHLKAGSPARDVSAMGPDHDLENNPRPRGVRFDLGAYEAL